MNGSIEKHTETIYFLSDLIGARAEVQGKRIGKLDDLLIREHEKIPEVTHIIVTRPFGHKALLVPLGRVNELGHERVVLDISDLAPYEGEPDEAQVLLKDHILDKKVIDLDGNDIDVVYDVKLVLRNGKLYATDVDFSKYGLLKRLGLRYVAKFAYHLAEMFKKETISWAYVQPLPERIGSFKGNVKLNILKEALPDIHPVDLADILEELSEEQRLAIFNELDTEQASDTLEEIEPRVQRSLISSLDKERVADLIDEMTPAQAADVLSVLPADEADHILTLMEHTETEKIESLLENQDESIINLTTCHFIRMLPNMTTGQIISSFRSLAADVDVVDYIYVVDYEERLRGVVSLPDLLIAEPGSLLKDIMVTQVISLEQGDTIDDAKEKFSRYRFDALPVTSADDIIRGVVTYRDVMGLGH